MRGVNFTPTPEERYIREATARLFPVEQLHSAREGVQSFHRDEIWKAMVDSGFSGMMIDPASGGAGMSLAEAMIAAEEGGRGAAPGLLAFGAVVGPAVVLSCNVPQQLLRDIASGNQRLTVAPEGVVAVQDQSIGSRSGDTLRFIPDLQGADILIARGSGSKGPSLVGLDLDALEAEPRRLRTFDPTRDFYELTVKGDSSDAVLFVEKGDESVALFERVGSAVMAADLLGGADRCLEMSIAHAREREQFGKKIGSFQAVKHLLVDSFIALELAKSACLWAAWSMVNQDSEAPSAVATAKALASETGRRLAEAAIQIHGGIGFTRELPLHLFLKRSQVSASLFGDTRHHQKELRKLLAAGELPDWMAGSAG